MFSFHTEIMNVIDYPQTWSEQSVSQHNAADPVDSSQSNPRLWGITLVNPKSLYPGGYYVRTDPHDSPTYSVSGGMFRVHWEELVGEVYVDTPSKWLAVVDGSGGYTLVERTRYYPTANYPRQCNGDLLYERAAHSSGSVC